MSAELGTDYATDSFLLATNMATRHNMSRVLHLTSSLTEPI